jgi:hypothetical protein
MWDLQTIIIILSFSAGSMDITFLAKMQHRKQKDKHISCLKNSVSEHKESWFHWWIKPSRFLNLHCYAFILANTNVLFWKHDPPTSFWLFFVWSGISTYITGFWFTLESFYKTLSTDWIKANFQLSTSICNITSIQGKVMIYILLNCAMSENGWIKRFLWTYTTLTTREIKNKAQLKCSYSPVKILN